MEVKVSPMSVWSSGSLLTLTVFCDGSVQIDGVKDPLCELLELGSRALRLFLQPLIVLPKPLNLCLQFQFLFPFLGKKKAHTQKAKYIKLIISLSFYLFTYYILFITCFLIN